MRNCFAVILFFVLIAGSMSLVGCGTKKEEPSQAIEQYGVADLEILVKSHPLYSEYFKKETEYNHLLERYKNERNKLIQIASMQAKLAAATEETALRSAAENELKLRVKEKEDEINKKLYKLYSEIEAKHNRGTENYNLENLSPEARAHMANLQMKLTVLGVSGDEKEKIKQELHELLATRTLSNSSHQTDWTKEEIEKMNQAKEEGRAELENYAAQKAEEIKTSLTNDRQSAAQKRGEALFSDSEQFNENWKKQLENKQKEMSDLKDSIMQDIRREAGRVASEKNIKMIFVKYHTNIKAVDLTGDISGRIINISRQEGTE